MGCPLGPDDAHSKHVPLVLQTTCTWQCGQPYALNRLKLLINFAHTAML